MATYVVLLVGHNSVSGHGVNLGRIRHRFVSVATKGIDTAGEISRRLPRPQERPGPKPFGLRSGQWQAVGAELARMKRAGWVDYDLSRHGQKEWSLTQAGRAIIARAPAVAGE